MYIDNLSDDDIKKEFAFWPSPIMASHNLNFINNEHHVEILREFNVKIKKVIFDKKFYPTIHIEDIFKNINFFLPTISASVDPIGSFEQLLREGSYRYSYFNSNNMIGRDLWSYENLYIHFDQKDELLNDIDWDKFKSYVDSSWLPESIELFGKTWRPRDYGYRDWE